MFLILGLIGIVTAAYFYLTWNFGYWNKRGVTNPKPQIFFGNLPSIWTRKRHATYEIDEIYKQFKGKHPFVGIIQFRRPVLLLLDPEVGKDVMIKYFSNFHDNEFHRTTDKELDPLFGRNPFLLTGEEWKKKRAEITPAFSPIRLKVMYPIIEDVTQRFKNYLIEKIKKDPKKAFDGRIISGKYTCDVVSSCAFGVDAQSFKTENPEIMTMGKKIFQPGLRFSLILILLTVSSKIAKFLKLGFVTKDVESFFIKIVEDAIKYREDHKVDRKDYLEHLISLRNKKELEPIDIAAHGITFFTDGFDTSSIVIAHALYELGRNPEVQEKLRREVSDNLDESGKLTFDKLLELPYLDQVFNETLRMHPPATFTNRECTNPIELQRGSEKVCIEKDRSVFIPIYNFHYDPEYYEKPEKFMPERFDDGKIKDFKNRGVFLPFGGGPRVCLGRKFAALQSKAILAELVKNFEISVDPKTEDPLILDPKEFLNVKRGGLWLNFKPL